MKIQVIISCLLFACCAKNKYNEIPQAGLQGTWQMQRVEILKDGQIKKEIKDAAQYWQFGKGDSIRIFSDRELRNSFPITVKDSLIQAPGEDYLIARISAERMELSNVQRVEETDYTVLYYLDKVTGDPLEKH